MTQPATFPGAGCVLGDSHRVLAHERNHDVTMATLLSVAVNVIEPLFEDRHIAPGPTASTATCTAYLVGSVYPPQLRIGGDVEYGSATSAEVPTTATTTGANSTCIT